MEEKCFLGKRIKKNNNNNIIIFIILIGNRKFISMTYPKYLIVVR